MHSEPQKPMPASVFLGGVLWLLFCPLAILFVGVQWDEAYERAQVITGLVRYPLDHPLYQWSTGAFTIFHALAAMVTELSPDGSLVGFYQDTLCLAAAIVPVYVLAAGIGRSALAAHLAATLMLLGVHLEFDSYYPLSVWPDRFTIAHIGLGYAILVLAAWVFDRRRLAAFLTGCMPMIHIGLMPPLLVLGLMMSVRALWQGERRQVLQACLAGLCGLALCGAYYLLRGDVPPPPLPGSPYFSAADPWESYTRYTQGTDVHRAFPRFGEVSQTWLLIVLTLGLGGLASMVPWPSPRTRRAVRGLTVFGVIVAGLYAGALFLQPHLDGRALFLVVGWMPHRLPNLLAPVLVALTCGIIARHAGRVILALTFFQGFVVFALPMYLFDDIEQRVDIVQRYLSPAEFLLFIALGFALHQVAAQSHTAPDHRRRLRFAIVFFLAACAWFHQAGAAYVIAAFLLAWCVPFETFRVGLAQYRWAPGFYRTVVVLALVGLVFEPIVWSRVNTQFRSPREDDYTALARFAASSSAERGMVLTPCWEINLQMQTRLPVFATYETQAIASYMPHLAASIEQMYTEVYGYRFGTRWDYNLDTWAKRSADEWIALGRKYDLAMVLAPLEMTLPLDELAVKFTGYRLYRLDAAPGGA
jgi:hypothetical protein